MKIFKCKECSEYFHKSMKHSKCIYCGNEEVEMIHEVKSDNKEAVRHFEKGFEYISSQMYELAKKEFFLATRFDLEYSEAYWMGYLAEIGVRGDDELIYSGKLSDNSMEIINAIKYAKDIEKQMYKEIIRVNSMLVNELLQLNELKKKKNILAELNENSYKEILKYIHKEYAEVRKYEQMIIESNHKLLNLNWRIQQKYANIEYAQLAFCNDVIEECLKKDYSNVAKITEGIIEISAVQKYQDSICIEEVEDKCKSCIEYQDILKETVIQNDLINKVKEHYNNLKKYKKTLMGYINNIELIEQQSCQRESNEDLYIGIDITQPLMVNYNKIKLEVKKISDVNYEI